jgi:DNA-binding NarL/FixJ family response regulator
VVDDHDIVRLGVRQVLSERWPDCEYHGGGALRRRAGRPGSSPDLLMLDLGLGDDFRWAPSPPA